MFGFIRGRIASFRPAFAGLFYVLRTQPNAWLHAVITLTVLAISFWVQIERTDWALILLTTALVWLAEFFNTAVEVVIDLVTVEEHPLAKIGKDIGAGAVVIAAAIAVIVGLLVLGPPVLERLRFGM
ncbi:MAG: diacylglycerol kinase family protein [Anaerolineales bacterium]